jgi:hypothetical protein
MRLAIAIAGALIFSAGAASAQTQAPGFPNLSLGLASDEDYRAQFESCDTGNGFRTAQSSLGILRSRTRWRGCTGDPNRVQALLRFPAKGRTGGALFTLSRMAVDLDGSWLACFKRGPTDQCGTSLMLKQTKRFPCVLKGATPDKCVPVDADRIPYVVIPGAGPSQAAGEEFRQRFEVSYGDYGVVIYRGKIVPVIVADGGPYNKLGEGSLALHRELGIDYCATRDEDGNCTELSRRPVSIAGDVAMILFPGSRDPRASLSPNTLAHVVQMKGLVLYKAFMREYGGKTPAPVAQVVAPPLQLVPSRLRTADPR